MRYYKDVRDGYIAAIGTGGGGTEITESDYQTIMAAIQSKPARTDTTDYHLTESLEWVEYERIDLPAEDEASAEEVADILLGGVDD